MKNTFTLALFFLGFNSFSTFGQSDIGITISNQDINRFAVDWRKSFSEKMKFKIGVSVGGYSGEIISGYPESSIMNDTLRQIFTHFNVNRISLKFGMERQIKSSIFYYGFDLMPGFQSNHDAYNVTKTPIHQDTSWTHPTLNGGPDGGITHQYLTANVLGTIGLNFPISNNFILNIAGNVGLDGKLYTSSKNKIDPEAQLNTLPKSTINSYLSGTIGIRYSFNKKS